jgi:hypothetical protein
MTTINVFLIGGLFMAFCVSMMFNYSMIEKSKADLDSWVQLDQLNATKNLEYKKLYLENQLLIKDLNYCNRDLLFAKDYSDIKVNGEDLNLAYGARIMGLNKPDHYIFLITNETSYEKVCLNFLHELGHERCWDNFKNQNEACAEKFALDNSWRCDVLN